MLNKVWEPSDFPVETEGKASAFDVQKIEKGKKQKRDGEKKDKDFLFSN